MRKLQDSVLGTAPAAPPAGYAITIGNFDGVHIGHRALIGRAKEEAGKLGCPLLIFTFSPQSSEQIAGKKAPRIYTDEQKSYILGRLAPEADLLFFSFDEALRSMREDLFFETVLKTRYQARAIIVGENFRYGKGGEGCVATLRRHCLEHGISLYAHPGVRRDGEWVSSTRIRGLLANGEMRKAAELLGDGYFTEGTVTQGKRLGRRLGFPTANLILPDHVVNPRHGVYYTRVATPDGVYAGISNVGVNPTVEHGQKTKVETHILNYTGDLYGRFIRVEFLRWMRDERRFDGVEQLKEQLQRDLALARGFSTAAETADWRKL